MESLEGKEEMGLEASLRLLDLPMDATIDDANQAYDKLHQMIEQYYQDADGEDQKERQSDIDLLTLAYENAISQLSERDSQHKEPAMIGNAAQTTDLHFTINFPGGDTVDEDLESISSLPEANMQTVEAALAVISQRLHEAEAALPNAQRAVDSATAALEAANREHERVRQESINAIVAAKSAKIRALLLEIEAKRAMEKAVAIAARARDRVTAAKRMANSAMAEAEKAQQAVGKIKQSEEAAATEAINAETRLEQAKERLKSLTNNLMETRRRIRLSRGTVDDETSSLRLFQFPDDASPAASRRTITTERQKMISELTELENSLSHSRDDDNRLPSDEQRHRRPVAGGAAPAEKRKESRIVYPSQQRPIFSLDGQTIPVIDLSSAGMRLKTNNATTCPRIIRGEIDFSDRPPVKVTGRVVRQDRDSIGLRLVTRIGNHILDGERHRLCA